ncbi:hypothetical protein PTMSG1_03406 [Pyrenophora teres f. maculata]|nr:hypothetical protein PTMSG1_03406 [Pyrenophora teres f. maculata]
MWKYISLFGPVLLATGSHANAYYRRDPNKPVPAIPSSDPTHANYIPQPPSDPEKPDFPDVPKHLGFPDLPDPPSLHSPFIQANPAKPPKSPQLPSLSHHVEADAASPPNAPSLPTPISTSPPTPPSFLVYHVPHVSSPVPPYLNSTSNPTNSTPTGSKDCTGCFLAAEHLITTSFDHQDPQHTWKSIMVTATVISEYITYMNNNNSIETVVTERKTVNQTKTVTISDQVITHHTPTFEVSVTEGVTVTLLAGPVYVIYKDIIGGLDHYNEQYWPEYNWTQKSCAAVTTQLNNWQPPKNATTDWSSFIATYTKGMPPEYTAVDQRFALPSKAIEYLKKEPAIMSQYHGSDIATCTASKPTASKSFEELPTPMMPVAPAPPLGSDVLNGSPMSTPLYSPLTSTYLATTYDTTSAHITVHGCLRCQDTSVKGLNVPTNKVNIPSQSRIGPPHDSGNTPTPVAPGQSAESATKPTPGPGIPTASMIIGGVLFPINVPRPTRYNNGQSPPPVIVIGHETLTPGETKTINGVPVNAPADDSGAVIVVGGSTFSLNPAVTPGPPVITIGGGRVEANPHGEFVFGPVTLKAGGPPIVVNGHIVSLGSNGVAIVNGVTQTISNAPAPTPIPAFVAGGQVVSATVVGGSPVFVIAPGQTLGAGSTLVVNSTTYGVPADAQGPVIVINGQTSTLSAGQPVITDGEGQPIIAKVAGGVPAYVLAPGQTLTPGGVVTVSGTTYALPADGSGNVVVVNGVTSTMANGAGITAAPALIINGVTYTNNVRDGTTEYILANGTTLAQGGAVVIDGTTYSLDKAGTALVINGQTSTISNLPKSTSATTTGSSSSSTTTTHNAGDLIASGIGETSKQRGAASYGTGIDRWIENMVICVAGWLIMLF